MKYFALFTLLAIGLAQAAPTSDVWELFKAVHQKTYETDAEDLLRQEIFLNNVRKIEEHNQKFESGEVSFKLGVNQYSDLTEEEYRASVLGFKKHEGKFQSTADGVFVADTEVELPSEVDWRTKGVVTAVKNQASCGSCWAFSTTGAVEGAHALKTGKLVSLSEEQLVECSSAYGNHGCRGGLPQLAYKYIEAVGGLESESEYPYTSGNGTSGRCKFIRSEVAAKISSDNAVASGDEEALKQAVATIGPISVGIDAHLGSFQFYHSGVYYDPDCSSEYLDHGVLAVGYGTENGKDYWLVKNSYGTVWGENGYIKMSRNRDNNCGIATSATYPIV